MTQMIWSAVGTTLLFAPLASGSLCNNQVKMGTEDSIWQKLTSHPSCKGTFKSGGVGMCSGDRTSITLNMSEVSDKQGCWAYSSEGNLEWDMNDIKQIDFDAEWQDCSNVWFAPLWLTPATWIAPQGTSGEIDLVESCRSHAEDTVGTSIICDQHKDPQCYEPQWGQAQFSNGPVHFVAKIDDSGTWTMEKCNFDGSNCQLVSRYPRYLETATGAKQRMQYHFMSDLYNGGDGDDGWKGCGTLNQNTQCKYTIANIKVSSASPTPPPSPPAPTPPAPPSAACSANAGCAALRLSGNCCPTDTSVMLDCCGSHAEAANIDEVPNTHGTPGKARAANNRSNLVGLNSTSWPTPFTAIGCGQVVVLDDPSAWLWGPGENFDRSHWPSCKGHRFSSQYATTCLNNDGSADITSIFVNMQAATDPSNPGCWVWAAPDCPIEMRDVSAIEFDIDWSQCDDTWVAPIWLLPQPWNDAGLSGEVDMAETTNNDMRVNFAGCGSVTRDGRCKQVAFGDAHGANGPRHYRLEMNGADLHTKVNGQSAGYFNHYLDDVHVTKLTMISDLWNVKSSSKCQYVVKNIRVYSKWGGPMYSGKCAMLNGNSATEVVV